MFAVVNRYLRIVSGSDAARISEIAGCFQARPIPTCRQIGKRDLKSKKEGIDD
jgi:hypothetical protein